MWKAVHVKYGPQSCNTRPMAPGRQGRALQGAYRALQATPAGHSGRELAADRF